MALTYQQIVDRARDLLHDPDKVAYPDDLLLRYLEQAVSILRVRRPDLFIDKLTDDDEESFPLTATDTVTIKDKYYPALVHYVVGMTQLQDDQHAINQRAAMSLNIFSTMTGVPIVPVVAGA